MIPTARRSNELSLSLKAYLVKLATDYQCLGDFIADPMGTAAQAGLSAEDCSILLSGDQGQIYARLSEPAQDAQDREVHK
jgi:hypothetical protein